MNIDTVKDDIHISMRNSIAKLKADYDISAPLKPIDSPLSKGNKDSPINTIDTRLINATKPLNKLIDDYAAEGKYKVHVVTDANFASDPDRKSQSGFITLFNNNVVSWGSVKQNVISLSTAQSEYIAVTEGLKSGICFSNLLNEFSLDSTYIELSGDNIASLHLAAHTSNHQATKHIDIKPHFVRDFLPMTCCVNSSRPNPQSSGLLEFGKCNILEKPLLD
ncbi:unnamed protein product [Ambrosiozyma monospora]|uniref:Unnamed protein product n=1 Tax=Ambrosiozyma monospora TaxID=43982 RepID=A0A9W7DGL8_AMBMO|nr:unnamed protein product [Ambrosiozyma monospora]